MDWADDITYAVHDLEDFYRAGKIPLDRLVHSRDEMDAFLEGMIHRLKARGGFSRDDENAYKSTARDLLDFCPVSAAYSGTRTQRTALHNFASSMIHNAVCGTTLTEDGLKRPLEDEKRIAILKQLTWHYVIEDARVAAEQHGKRKVIRTLFDAFADAAASEKKWKLFPPNFQEQLREGKCSPARTASDYVAWMGEQRAVELFSELSGIGLKPIATGVIL